MQAAGTGASTAPAATELGASGSTAASTGGVLLSTRELAEASFEGTTNPFLGFRFRVNILTKRSLFSSAVARASAAVFLALAALTCASAVPSCSACEARSSASCAALSEFSAAFSAAILAALFWSNLGSAASSLSFLRASLLC